MGDERVVAIVLAAGAGTRVGAGEPKAFLPIDDRPMLALAASAAAACTAVDAVIVTAPSGFEDRARACLGFLEKPSTVITGGPLRQDSVRVALAASPTGTEIVLVHDAARPFATNELFAEVAAAVAAGADGAIPVVPVPDTVKRVRDGVVVNTESREGFVFAQTPQGFRVGALRQAHAAANEAGREFTDDAAALEWAGYAVRTVPGELENVKITTALDLDRAVRRGRVGRV
ncbi:MAG: 2-C-methyl-D-erythritol 4-phosphate cytidylyltransferase [Actinomycetota bacterium]|nr:2-C-methyl-D-erythritol 4-phosphate cytidylyltransferase [Actinomycetota bacterium]